MVDLTVKFSSQKPADAAKIHKLRANGLIADRNFLNPHESPGRSRRETTDGASVDRSHGNLFPVGLVL